MNKFILCLLAAVAFSAHAEVYKWRDADGKLHYGDVPASSRTAKTVAPPAAVSADQRAAAEGRLQSLRDDNKASAEQAKSDAKDAANAAAIQARADAKSAEERRVKEQISSQPNPFAGAGGSRSHNFRY